MRPSRWHLVSDADTRLCTFRLYRCAFPGSGAARRMIRAATNSSAMKRNLLLSLLALLLVLLVGTVGYRVLGGEKYSWLDCFYMTFITISTIGYHEVVDVNQYEYGKLFTVFVGMTGIGVLGYVL